MFYAILAIVVVVALILIFRDDHDDSYNRKETSYRQPEKPKVQTPTQPQVQPKPQAQPTVQIPTYTPKPTPVVKPVPKVVVPEPKVEEDVDLSFLDRLDYSEDLEENTETFDITGLRYHCTVKDCGTIVGVVKPEPSNVHDARAQAVIRSDGKLLGYIPRTQLDWYEDFNEQNVPCPFVGEIELDRGSARLIAEIKVIIPTSKEFVENEIVDEL